MIEYGRGKLLIEALAAFVVAIATGLGAGLVARIAERRRRKKDGE